MRNAMYRFVLLTSSKEIQTKDFNRTQKFYETVPRSKMDLIPNKAGIIILALLIQFLLAGAACLAQTREERTPYLEMAPLKEYIIQNKDEEIALARSAAPPSISMNAEVMVLGRTGYTTAVKGTNGFVCVVERSWGTSTDDPGFWNPKDRAPICFNPSAARTFLPIYLLKTKLVLEGKSKKEIAQAIDSAFDKKELKELEPGAMSYMMSKLQYLNDQGKSWHPHLMFYVSGDAAKSWGANLDGSPVIASNDPQERATVFMVWVGNWSDGTPAPPITQ